MSRLPGLRRLLLLVALLGAVLGVLPAPSLAATSGPPLDVPAARLAAALGCHGDLRHAPLRPVLLVPGTTLTPQVNFGWNYEKVYSAAGRPWCAVTLPNHAMTDIQVAGEYVVAALRHMHAAAGRRVSVVGFSQGGMVPRWALKWWPDTRAMVDDMIGIDPSNHGTLDAQAVCSLPCAPAFWQQRTGSRFLTVLNRGGETFAGISYTQVYTATDEIVVPNLGPAASSSLHTGTGRIANLLAQSICPVHVADHLTMGTFDPVAYAVVSDALAHAGPASVSRISRRVCLQAAMPGVSLASALTHLAQVGATAGEQALTAGRVPAEPPLAPYAR